MSKQTSYTVGEVARMTRVSVRALHHYDEIGLLRPSGRSAAGYRHYATTDLARLRQIMSFKLLGFPLEEIRLLLDDPAFDLRAALVVQRRLLVQKRDEVAALVAAVDALLANPEGAETMEENFESFKDFDPTIYEAEAEARWGDADTFREAARRTKGYGDEDWAALKAEAAGIYTQLAALRDAGAAPSDAAVQALIEQHRLHIARWFYPCSARMHRALSTLYASDPRYAKNIDRGHTPGLTRFLCAAIEATK
jgi:DNA-binding transcriptional MerR regulator